MAQVEAAISKEIMMRTPGGLLATEKQMKFTNEDYETEYRVSVLWTARTEAASLSVLESRSMYISCLLIRSKLQ